MTYRTVVKELENAGWVLVRIHGSHHQFKNPAFIELVTVPCHGGHDLSIGVVRNIQKVTGLSFER